MTKGLPRRCIACGSPFDSSNLDKKLCRYCETALERMQGYVAPVVHGRWEKDPDMRRMNGHIYDYRCSHCHSPAEKGCYNNNDRFTDYCPNCGAKMDAKV